LELTALGADLVVQAAAVMRGLFDQLLRPIGGRTGKRQVVLIRTLEVLLDEAEALNRVDGTRTPGVSRRHPNR